MYYYGRRDAASRLYNINVAILITHHCPHWNDNFATLFSGAFGQVQKKIDCLTTINLVNLKSNTMKNTVQRYMFYAIQHNFQATKCNNLTLISKHCAYYGICNIFQRFACASPFKTARQPCRGLSPTRTPPRTSP